MAPCAARLARGLRWLMAYPKLIVRYITAPRHDAVLVPYMGHLDVLLLKPLARLRGAPIVWDAFLSLWDTVVLDRRMVGERHFLARALRWLEGRACHAADIVVLDTEAHAGFFRETYSLSPGKTAVVFVGAEADRFPWQAARPRNPDTPVRVLFYGQFAPLHGVPTIVEAARLARNKPIDWVLIGGGQEEERVRRMLKSQPSSRLTWIPWVPYDHLIDELARADVCLGIFGDSAKAGRVIPNKVFQILSTGRPLVTRDSPAIRELAPNDNTPGIELIPPADPEALVAAVERLARDCSISPRQAYRYLQQAQRLKKPVPVGEAKLAFTVKLPRSLIRRVRLYASVKRISISDVVSRALVALLLRGGGRG